MSRRQPGPSYHPGTYIGRGSAPQHTIYQPTSATSYHAPYGYAAPQHHATHVRRRRAPQLPVELWMHVITFFARRELITALLVCRMFKESAWKALLRTIFVHLDDESAAKGNLLLYRIATNPTWARRVKHMVVFMKDHRDPNFITNLICALRSLSHLSSFKLIVTGYIDEFPEYHSNIRIVADTVLQHCLYLEELMVPHTMISHALASMTTLTRLRKLTSCGSLGPDMQVTDTHARHFVQVGHNLFRQSNGHQCRSLTTLRLDFNVVAAVPKQVFAQLTELDIYNLDGEENRELFDEYLQSARRLRSLTLQRWLSPSATPMHGYRIKPGQVLAPNAPDDDDVVLSKDANGDYCDLTALTDNAGRADDPLQRLTSFRYIAYRGVMSPRVCKGVLRFLEKRTGLRRVDLKAVFCNKHYAEQALRVLGRFRHLQVLGIEFRDVRNGLGSGLELLRYIPKTVTHLKYNVIGWRLDDAPSTPDTVVKRALDKCPQLQFLHIYDGIRFLNKHWFTREVGKPQLSTPVRHFDFKQLRFLAIEYNWMDIVRDSRGGADIARWSARETMYGGLEGWERLGADGEWLARYNTDIMCTSTYS